MTIYLDHAATAPMSEAVIAAYAKALTLVGNPSSIHSSGQSAKRMLEESREVVAAALGADRAEVTFTSGGTESINLAIKGLFWRAGERRRILSTQAEHHATLDALHWLEQHEGATVDWIPVDAVGRIDLAALAAAVGDDVALMTTLMANNEVGTVQPVAEIVDIAGRHNIPVHVDAVSAFGQIDVDFHALGAAALSVSAHKIGGPVGVGALLISRSIELEPLIHGGEQQRGRSGTQDAPGAAAFAAAVGSDHSLAHQRELRDRLIDGIRVAVPEAIVRGDLEDRLPGNVHITVPGCEGDSLLFLLDVAGFAVSTGSACRAGIPEASHVLLAMGLDEPTARGALRFTLGPTSTATEVDALLAVLPRVVEQARSAGFADREPQLGR